MLNIPVKYHLFTKRIPSDVDTGFRIQRILYTEYYKQYITIGLNNSVNRSSDGAKNTYDGAHY